MTTVHTLSNAAIVSHAFNGDGTEVVVSLYTTDLYILRVPTGPAKKFIIHHVLKGHSAPIIDVDWAPRSDRIVSCSIDRNAYVWTRTSDGKWERTSVTLTLSLAPVCVKWSPDENLFAAGSSCKAVSICSFEEKMNWWVGKRIKNQFKSTVTCVDWHPNSAIIACGSSDFHMRVFTVSTATKNAPSPWGDASGDGKLLFDHHESEGSWILSVAFSADGNRLVWTKHNSLIFVADVTPGSAAGGVQCGPAQVYCLRTEFLPFSRSLWVGKSTFIAAGYDCCPMAFQYTPGKGIEFIHRLDVEAENRTKNKLSAMRKFQDIDRMATTDSGSRQTTIHQNCINDMKIYKGTRSDASCVSTVGRDGVLVFWDLPALCEKIAELTIS